MSISSRIRDAASHLLSPMSDLRVSPISCDSRAASTLRLSSKVLILQPVTQEERFLEKAPGEPESNTRRTANKRAFHKLADSGLRSVRKLTVGCLTQGLEVELPCDCNLGSQGLHHVDEDRIEDCQA